MYTDIINESKKYFGVVYLLTNTLTSKSYIGQTINLTARIRQYRYESNNEISSDRLISKIVYKYKFENFKLKILQFCDSIDEMNFYESYWIDKFDTIVPNGYNSNYGGDNYIRTTGTKWSEDRIKKNSIAVVAYNREYKKLFKFDSAVQFADFIYRPRTQVTRSAKHGYAVKEYYVFYYDLDKLEKTINRIEQELNIRKSNSGHSSNLKNEYLRIAKLIYSRSVEIIEPYVIII